MVHIPAYSEFRFEVEFYCTAKIKLLDGSAEFFGQEMCPEREYSFAGEKGAIFSWKGAKIEISFL